MRKKCPQKSASHSAGRNQGVTKKRNTRLKVNQKVFVDSLVRTVSEDLLGGETSLPALWQQLRPEARFYLVLCVAYYMKWVPEAPYWNDKKRRLTPTLKAISVQIRQLRGYLKKRRLFEELEDPIHGRICALGTHNQPFRDPLSVTLGLEVERLEQLTKNVKKTLNEKRQGLAGAVRHLVLAQKFVAGFRSPDTTALDLQAAEIAEMIELIHSRQEKRPDFNRADNLRHALVTFKANPDNASLLEGIEGLSLSEVERAKQLSPGSEKS